MGIVNKNSRCLSSVNGLMILKLHCYKLFLLSFLKDLNTGRCCVHHLRRNLLCKNELAQVSTYSRATLHFPCNIMQIYIHHFR